MNDVWKPLIRAETRGMRTDEALSDARFVADTAANSNSRFVKYILVDFGVRVPHRRNFRPLVRCYLRVGVSS